MSVLRRVFFLGITALAMLSCKRDGSTVTSPPDDVSDTTLFVDSVDFTPKAGMSVITGQVFDKTSPLQGARVVLDSPLYGAMADSLGRFWLSAPTGLHTITCRKTSYAVVNATNIFVREKDYPIPGTKPDTIRSEYIRTEHIPSYQPVNLTVTSYADEHKITITRITCDRKLIDPYQCEPKRIRIRIYKKDPRLHAQAIYEFPINGLYGLLKHDSNGRITYAVDLNLSILTSRYFVLKPGDEYYLTLTFTGDRSDIGTRDKIMGTLTRTNDGPESEPLKFIAE